MNVIRRRKVPSSKGVSAAIYGSGEVNEGVGIVRSSQLSSLNRFTRPPLPPLPLLQLITRQQDEPTPTWPKDDRIPDHDIIRLRSPRDPSRWVCLESSEISDETSSCGRRLVSPGVIKSRSKSGRFQMDKWRFVLGQYGLLGIVVMVVDLEDHMWLGLPC